MTTQDGPLDISSQLAQLKHEKMNQKMKSLPDNLTVQKRPLHHPPVASPYAGSDVQKVVYVSTRTPLMSAVKRVKKLLSHVEKRANQASDTNKQQHGRGPRRPAALAESVGDVRSNRSATTKLYEEEVLIKASGRAMEQALRVGEWFRSKEQEVLCKVAVRTGSVRAVDDLVSVDQGDGGGGDSLQGEGLDDTTASTLLEGGDTTLELLGKDDESGAVAKDEVETNVAEDHGDENVRPEGSAQQQQQQKKKRKRTKRKRAVYDEDDVPESRIRWINTVEIAISLRA